MVGLADEVPDDAARVPAADLVGRQQQVDALYHVPHGRWRARVERSTNNTSVLHHTPLTLNPIYLILFFLPNFLHKTN